MPTYDNMDCSRVFWNKFFKEFLIAIINWLIFFAILLNPLFEMTEWNFNMRVFSKLFSFDLNKIGKSFNIRKFVIIVNKDDFFTFICNFS